MQIREITENKKQYLPLLLLADEQEDMIDRYLEKGTMYILEDNGVKAECVVTDEGDRILEIKNIAVEPDSRGMGYGRRLIEALAELYASDFDTLRVGTGDSPPTLYTMAGVAAILLGAGFMYRKKFREGRVGGSS